MLRYAFFDTWNSLSCEHLICIKLLWSDLGSNTKTLVSKCNIQIYCHYINLSLTLFKENFTSRIIFGSLFCHSTRNYTNFKQWWKLLHTKADMNHGSRRNHSFGTLALHNENSNSLRVASVQELMVTVCTVYSIIWIIIIIRIEMFCCEIMFIHI